MSNKGMKFPNRKKPPEFTEEHRKNIAKGQVGRINKPWTEEEKDKVRNENNYNWKGDKASYSGIHKWVVRHKGRPDTCEMCGDSGFTAHKINWANVDNQYRRVLDDYIRLCGPCHSRYDRDRNIGSKHNKKQL